MVATSKQRSCFNIPACMTHPPHASTCSTWLPPRNRFLFFTLTHPSLSFFLFSQTHVDHESCTRVHVCNNTNAKLGSISLSLSPSFLYIQPSSLFHLYRYIESPERFLSHSGPFDSISVPVYLIGIREARGKMRQVVVRSQCAQELAQDSNQPFIYVCVYISLYVDLYTSKMWLKILLNSLSRNNLQLDFFQFLIFPCWICTF